MKKIPANIGIALMLFALGRGPVLAQSGPPAFPDIFPLNAWFFEDSAWLSASGDPPLQSTNVDLVPTWDGNGLQVDSSSPAFLNFNLVESDGWQSLDLTQGSARFWFLPNWLSTNLDGGTGPGVWGRMIDAGNWTSNASYGWFSLYVDPAGCNLFFSAQNNTGVSTNYVSVPISWDDTTWHEIELTWCATNTALYLDGTVAARGPGLTVLPPPEALTNGFSVGSDYATGMQQSHGQFDNLWIFSGPENDTNAIASEYARNASIANPPRFHGNDTPTFPDGDGGTGTNSGADSILYIPSYGSNDFWLEILPLGTNAYNTDTNSVTLVLHGTIADIDYQIQSTTNVQRSNTVWTVEQDILGSPDTNFTPTTVSMIGHPTRYFRALAYTQDDDGDGLPTWWENKYGLSPTNADTGNTGIPDGYKEDSAHDGWNNLQKYQMGIAPGTWTTPPDLTGFNVTLNPGGTSVAITWNPAPGSVTGYVIERADYDTNTYAFGDFQTIATLSTTNTSFTDTGSFADGDPLDEFLEDGSFSESYPGSKYRARATYGGGDSPVAQSPMLDYVSVPAYAVDAKLVHGPAGRWQLAFSAIPTAVESIKIDWQSWDYWIDVGTGVDSQTIAVTNLVNGCYIIPDEAITNFVGYNSWMAQGYNSIISHSGFAESGFVAFVRGIGADGKSGPYFRAGVVGQDAPFFLNTQQHLRDNLSFLIRAAGLTQPYSEFSSLINTNFLPLNNNFVEMGLFHPAVSWKDEGFQLPSFLSLDNTWPLVVNYNLANWLYTTNPVAGLTWPLDFTTPPSALTPGGPYQSGPFWIGQGVDNLADLGVSTASNGMVVSLAGGLSNTFGLKVTNGLCQGGGLNPFSGLPYPSDWQTVAAGGSMSWTNVMTSYFSQVETPGLQIIGYYFAPINTPGTALIGSISPSQGYLLPVTSTFAVTNETPLIIGAVGQPIIIGGWAKMAITNSSAGKYAYLGQYFTNAYKIDTNGVVTTNTTGILSPYGEFLPTEPGPVALLTMPDLTTGQQGTCTVQVIKLQLDVNHDGTMDTSFAGPDNTSADRPFQFWVNDDFDREYPVGSGLEEDDLATNDSHAGSPFTAIGHFFTSGPPVPDCEYRNSSGERVIPSKRDLEDFARLWVSGVTTNMLASLPTNVTAELSWGDKGSPNTNNPTIDVFGAAEADGGMGYLTNFLVSLNQTNHRSLRLGPGDSIEVVFNSSLGMQGWNHAVWCGVKKGSGKLTLTFTQGTNKIAETSTYIEIKDIKEMYERWTVGDVPQKAPTSQPYLATEGVSKPFQYSTPTGTNTSYILLVHDYDLPVWKKDRYAETAFKRLYWQGYQGRFGLFRWPGAPDSLLPLFDSEFNSWRSGVGLLNILTHLNAQYSTNVFLMAHGYGAIAAGEALRLAGTNQLVDTYIAMQGAVPAHAYDPSLTNRLLNSTGISLDSSTPNRYLFYSTNTGLNYFSGVGGAGRYINFYDTNDVVLTGAWRHYQDFKPAGIGGFFGGGLGYTWDGVNFLKGSTPLLIPANTYEIFSYCDEARCEAIGAQPNLAGPFTVSAQLDLSTLYFGVFGVTAADHNVQFKTFCADDWAFWNALLKSLGL